MRPILIVGAGQCGLLLGHGLLRAGYEVTMLTQHTPQEIRGGRPTSTQVMFGPALAIERKHGLDLWAGQAPGIHGLRLSIAAPSGGPHLDVHGTLQQPAVSVDQRIKMAGWMELFAARGGRVLTMGVSTGDLDDIVASGRYDLTVVATGRGDLTALFDRDPDRSPHTVPQRALAAAYVHGMRSDPDARRWPHASLTVLPGMGELILIPALTTSGVCDILFWESVPGGPLDVFTGLGPAEHLHRALDLVREHTPWLYPRCTKVELTDRRATLAGRFTPTVRHPVGDLPSGGAVLGAADVTIANDPLAAQGANTAARAADAYLTAILQHGSAPFDRDWMQTTFDTFWANCGRQVTAWSNALLQPPPEHIQRILAAAATHPPTADQFTAGFADPTTLGWVTDPAAADTYLHRLTTPATPAVLR